MIVNPFFSKPNMFYWYLHHTFNDFRKNKQFAKVTAMGFEPTTTLFVNKHSTI